MGKKAKASSLFPYPHLAIPVPGLESDFRMRIQLSSQSASVAVGDGFKKWTTVAKGEWSGGLGCGVVVVSKKKCPIFFSLRILKERENKRNPLIYELKGLTVEFRVAGRIAKIWCTGRLGLHRSRPHIV